jgi:hypothetical protein
VFPVNPHAFEPENVQCRLVQHPVCAQLLSVLNIVGQHIAHSNTFNWCYGVQLKKLKSAVLVAAKMKALMADMKIAAEKAVTLHGVKGATAGNLTPLRRFTEDKNVPASTRYEVPEELIHAQYEASEQDADAMDAWDRELAKVNESLKKEGAPGTSKGGSLAVDTIGADTEPGCVPGSQESTLSLLDDTGSLQM